MVAVRVVSHREGALGVRGMVITLFACTLVLGLDSMACTISHWMTFASVAVLPM